MDNQAEPVIPKAKDTLYKDVAEMFRIATTVSELTEYARAFAPQIDKEAAESVNGQVTKTWLQNAYRYYRGLLIQSQKEEAV